MQLASEAENEQAGKKGGDGPEPSLGWGLALKTSSLGLNSVLSTVDELLSLRASLSYL